MYEGKEFGIVDSFGGRLDTSQAAPLYTESKRSEIAQREASAQASRASAAHSMAGVRKIAAEIAAGGKGAMADPKSRFDAENKLRDEFQKQSGTFIKIRDAYGKVQAAASEPSAAGDIALIFAYMRMLDPDSVVREGEFATAQNATGIPDRVRNMYNRAVNGQRLNPAQRGDFLNQAKKVYGEQERGQNLNEKTYTDLAGRYGLDLRNIVTPYALPDQQPAGAAGSNRPPLSSFQR